MKSQSNLYADRILLEHPNAIWALDDTVDFLSLIYGDKRNLSFTSFWTVSGVSPLSVTLENASNIPTVPFPEDYINKIVNTSSGSISFAGNNLIQRSSLSEDLENITLSFYTYIEGSVGSNTKAKLGFDYGDYSVRQEIDIDVANTWVFISKTFELPSYTYYPDNYFEPFIGFTNLNNSNKKIYVNGITFGQLSEEFAPTSLGSISTFTYPSDFPINLGSTGVVAKKYGNFKTDPQVSDGVYVIENGKILAKNSGIPMIYGAKNVTMLSPSSSENPSLVLPGFGFLHNSGKNRDMSIDFWLRINPHTSIPKKIFGPIASSDGLYVDGSFLIWKIGKYFGSYYVSEWYRPMLVSLIYTASHSSVMVNGKEVILLNFEYDDKTNTNDLDFPKNKFEVNNSGATIKTKNYNWLGFYCYEDIFQMELDCVGIYSYEIPSTLSKRRWAYGQAVEFPEGIISDNGGTSTVVDFPSANYVNNFNYPAQNKWEHGIMDAVASINDTLSSTAYSAPEVYFDNKTEVEWQATIQDTKNICLVPTPDWENTNGYITFGKLRSFRDNIVSIYGVFQIPINLTSTQILFKLFDENTGSYLQSTIDSTGSQLQYDFYSAYTDLHTTWSYDNISDIDLRGTSINAGICFNSLTTTDGNQQELANFINNKQRLSVYVGGNELFTNTFTGVIENFSFVNNRNFLELDGSPFINSAGFFFNNIQYNSSILIYDGGSYNTSTWDFDVDGGSPETTYIYNDSASPTSVPETYTVIDGENFNTESLSIVDGGSYNTTSWTSIYDAGTPVLQISGGMLNNSLMDRYATYSLFGKSYLESFELSIASNGYWEDYIPLKSLAKKINDSTYDLSYLQFNVGYPKPVKYLSSTAYDTTKSSVRTYISFQQNNANRNLVFTTTVEPKIQGLHNINNTMIQSDKRFEVVDGDVINIVDLTTQEIENLYLVIHVELNSPDILTRPIRIKSLQIAGKTNTVNTANPIGTKFGSNIYQYEQDSNLVNVNANPFTIGKQMTPYLYLTRSSGIKSVSGNLETSGLAVPVNTNKDTEYKLSSFVASIRYDENYFPNKESKIATIKYATDYVDFYISPYNSKLTRAKIYAKLRSTGASFTNLQYFINGRLVSNPVINVYEWNNFGVLFNSPINMYNSSDDMFIAFVNKFTFNNVVCYKSLAYISSNEGMDLTYYYGVSPNRTNNLLIRPKKVVIEDKGTPLSANSYSLRYYKDISTTTKTLTPA
jgi:hypothetical protein